MKDTFEKPCPFCNKNLKIVYTNDLIIECDEKPFESRRVWIRCPNCKRRLTLTQLFKVDLSVVEGSTPDYDWSSTAGTGTNLTFNVPYTAASP